MKRPEHVLACVSASPFSRKVVKTASQLAEMYRADFSAIYVDADGGRGGADDQSRLAAENTQYAEKLGARLTTACGGDVAGRIADFARVSGVTKIVVGRSAVSRKWPRSRDIARKLSRLLPGTEIIIIPNTAAAWDGAPQEKGRVLTVKDTAVTLGVLAATTLACACFYHLGFTDATLITVYNLAVLLIAFWTNSYVYGAAASLVSMLTFNYLFAVPRFSLHSYASGYPLTLVVMFIAAFLTSSLTSQVKRQAQQHAQNAYRTEVLLNSNRRMQLAADEDGILKEAAEQLRKLLMRSVLLYPVRDGGLCEPILAPAGESEEALRASASAEPERLAAQWVLDNNTQGGATTGIYGDSGFWYLAVRMNEKPCAVSGIRVEKGESIDAFDKNLLLAMLGECSVALEKERLDRTREEYAFRARQERMRSDLLRSISHDLRTPLTSISGNANMLLQGVEDEKDRRRLYGDIYDDSLWLIGLVENLLSITKMDDGRLKLALQPEDVSDILDAAVSHAQPRRKNHALRVEKSGELMIVNADVSLIVQLLVNLIENAFKYSAEDGAVVLSARREGDRVLISVADDGPGIPDAEKEKVFGMFYTVKDHPATDGRRGLGLGLALCRTIAQAHGGTVSVRDNRPRGCVFELALPAVEASNDK